MLYLEDTASLRDLSRNYIISDIEEGIVCMNSTHCIKKIIELLDDKNTYKKSILEIISTNIFLFSISFIIN